MDCPEIRDSFQRGETPVGPAVEQHLKWCPHCAELFKNAAALGRSLGILRPQRTPDIGPVLRAVEQDVASETGLRAKLRSLPTRTRLTLVLGAALLLTALGSLVRLRADIHSYPRGWMVGISVTYALAVLLGAWGALRPLAMRGPRVPLQIATALGLAILPSFIAVAFAISGHPVTDVPEAEFYTAASRCFVYGSVLSLPVVALLWALDRAERTRVTVAILFAVTLGITASLILQLHCSVTDLGHLLLGHASIGLVWAIVIGGVTWLRERSA